ncbi:Cof-type HAD-IIB family hydrolase [Natranaerobius thermophilus]|uniref:Cof-like hydrolase n=1 Tax=Natranaerobius thermophilus (strain ATCC BAA-1301 / DSM 18059 / JW/NM-WN-LF) TaxID=457570 RepID=B2A708_NATTJ|nr:Cof-type HAD-IIB family hydrolase [Natranaerobius thermophilus]ACB85599.1 Cof-like hydrolase [Natranaerobius thermophilus JW/NM-WN-LF]
MYRFVAIDIDDTLINNELDITEANKESIKAAINHGVLVTLATGRMFKSALPYAKELGLDLPLITYHGALIKTAVKGEVLYHKPVPLETTLQVVRLAKEKELHLNLYIDDELIVEEENKYTDYYTKIAGVSLNPVGDLENYLKQYPHKIPTKLTVVASEQMVKRLNYEFNQFFGQDLLVTESKSDFLELTHPEANKGDAVAKLAEIYNIPQSKTMAIGDSLNDISMIKTAGMGVAVENARSKVKDVADTIVSANDESGVSEAIERFVLSDSGREMNGIN